jgi:hypothetical protein
MNSDEDKVPIYVHRGMKGKLFVHESDGKVKLKLLVYCYIRGI